MFTLDARTIILSYVISNAICAGVMAILWWQNRRRFVGLGFWLTDFVLQLVALILVALRGSIPDWISMVVSNSLALAGTILLYVGLERFVGKRGLQIQNAILLVAFIVAQTYFALVQPNLTARNINLALGLIVMCAQSVWLLLRRVDADMRPITWGAGAVFTGYLVINVVRVAVDLAVSSGNDLFHSDVYDTLIILTYQMLFVILTFTLFLMVNRRLVADLEHDIAERQRAEKALRESEGAFRGYFNMGTIGMCVTSPQKGWIEVNDRLCDMLGYSRDELMRMTWAEMTHPDDLASDVDLFNQVMAGTRESYELEKRFISKDGQVVQTLLAVACQRNLDGIVRHILASLIDITERKRVEELIRLRLRLLEFAATHLLGELLQKALDEICEITNSPIGFFHFVEPDQKTLSLQAWSTRTLNEFCHAEGEGMHYDIDQAGVWVDCVLQRQPVIHNDYAALPHRKGLPEGHAQVIRELVVPVMRAERVVSILGVGNKPIDYHEQDVELVAYIADVVWTIVERKRLEDDVRQAKEVAEATNVQLATTVRELQARNEELDAFSHTVAHDIRSPVSQMVGVAEMLAEMDAELSPEAHEKSLGMLMRAGEKLTNIIDELLLLAGLRHVEVQPEPLNMTAIVNEALARLQHVVEQAGAEVTIANNESWPTVLGHPAWVEEVWVNYISNACKYGRVDDQPPRIVLGADPTGFENSSGITVFRFWTRDYGMGIALDDQSRLFTPFTRLDQVRVRGHGLGLSIVRRIVEKLGGEIGVQSDGVPGHGSEFSFTLPTVRVE